MAKYSLNFSLQKINIYQLNFLNNLISLKYEKLSQFTCNIEKF